MDISELILLGAAVFGASMLQAATGIGYGVIAGPILLVVLNGAEAFQISTVHNLLIALMLAPFVFRGIDRLVLKRLLIGSSLGIPAGFALLSIVSVVALKVASAIAIGFVAFALVRDMTRKRRELTQGNAGKVESTVVGAAAGVMGGMLAMPGPLASTWMSIRGWRKSEIRSTILMFFVFAYGAGFILHGVFSDISADTLKLSALLSPVVVAGIVSGNMVTELVSERAFRRILLLVLFATLVSLVASIG